MSYTLRGAVMPQAIPYRRYSLGQKMTAVYYSSSLFYFVGMRLVICHSTLQLYTFVIVSIAPCSWPFLSNFLPPLCLSYNIYSRFKIMEAARQHTCRPISFSPRLYHIGLRDVWPL